MRHHFSRAFGLVTATIVALSGVAQPPAAFADVNGTVTGHVTDANTGADIPHVCVAPYSDSGMPMAGMICGDDTGHYTLSLAPGSVFLQFMDPTRAYLDAFSGDSPTLSGASLVDVVSGQTTIADAHLVKGGVITGVAQDAKTGAPIAGICGSAMIGTSSDYAGMSSCSGPDGVWSAIGLPAGSYTVQLAPEDRSGPYLPRWVGSKRNTQATASLFTIAAGQSVQAPATTFPTPGLLTGRVVGPDGRPVAGVIISPRGTYDGRAGWGESLYETQTDADGRYRVAVPPGNYTPLFWSDTFAPQWAGGAVTLKSGEVVNVGQGQSVTVRAKLLPASALVVSVVDGSGASHDAVGLVFTSAGDYIGDFDIYQGQFTGGRPLPSGRLLVQVQDNDTGTVTWYDGAASQAQATRIPLAIGKTKSITVHLP
ncbi:MAG: carboxypeptidase regulatory-like domain-containing protein [Actinomycetales bacterium]|nr:carboxypeptidase regulatory-like domain-containing protein [Candidatus Phosphoribacter baldrii]